MCIFRSSTEISLRHGKHKHPGTYGMVLSWLMSTFSLAALCSKWCKKGVLWSFLQSNLKQTMLKCCTLPRNTLSVATKFGVNSNIPLKLIYSKADFGEIRGDLLVISAPLPSRNICAYSKLAIDIYRRTV